MATLPVEETESSEEIEGLVYKRLEGRYRGWRVELLEEQLTNKLEKKFLLCSYCSGVVRDACLLEREGKQELRCLVCIPEGVAWQPGLMNREAVNEKTVSAFLFVCVHIITANFFESIPGHIPGGFRPLKIFFARYLYRNKL